MGLSDYALTTGRDAFPIPRMDDMLDRLSGCKWLTTLDLISGYWQVEVAPEDREKTAFGTPWGLYEFNVMLCNAPAMRQPVNERVAWSIWTT